MISIETLEKLAKQYQTGLFPNIVREYFQHTFLAELYKLPEAEKMLFKGRNCTPYHIRKSAFSKI